MGINFFLFLFSILKLIHYNHIFPNKKPKQPEHAGCLGFAC